MAKDLYVVGAEFSNKALQIQKASRCLGSYAANLSALMRRVYESKAISSADTRQQLEEISKQLGELGRALSSTTNGIVSMTDEFVRSIDVIDKR